MVVAGIAEDLSDSKAPPAHNLASWEEKKYRKRVYPPHTILFNNQSKTFSLLFSTVNEPSNNIFHRLSEWVPIGGWLARLRPGHSLGI